MLKNVKTGILLNKKILRPDLALYKAWFVREFFILNSADRGFHRLS
jgi:hypothetical protein